MAPAVGTGIGTYLSERKNGKEIDEEEIENDLALQILQGNYIIFQLGHLSIFLTTLARFTTHLAQFKRALGTFILPIGIPGPSVC